MQFEHNPYYNPERCGLSIFESVDTADSYEYNIFCVWLKEDDNTLHYDSDSGCSCPSPFDNGDHGHDLKPITKETFNSFIEALENHSNIDRNDIFNIKEKVSSHMRSYNQN